MASIEKILNTRIQLKYDSYTNWTTNNPTLKSGEVAIAYLAPASDANKPTPDNGTYPVMFKVGPGAFNSLPWASALAADVHSWAKKSESEFTTWVKGLIDVSDIDAYSKGEVDGLLSSNSAADQKYAKDYADGLAKNYDAAGTAQGLIDGLDVEDTAVTGKYVSAVSEADGKISVTRADLPTYTLASGSANGTVAFNGADVAVTGLGSAAYTDSKDYATAAQGTKADSALQSADIATGSANGTISVKGANVAVHGLGSAAYTEASAYATSAQGAKADSAVQSVSVLGKELSNGGSVSVEEAKTALGLGSAAYENTDAFDAAGSASAVNTALETYKTSNDAAVAAVRATADAAATQAALEGEISRATQAEAKALEDAKKYTDDMKDALLGEGIKDTFDTLVEIQNWIEGDGVNATELSTAIAAEADRAKGEEARIEGLTTTNAGNISKNAEDIAKNAQDIAALGIVDGKVNAAAKADVASSLDEAGVAQVQGIKVNNAGHADTADKATDSDKLGGVAADQYALKTDAQGYANTAEQNAKDYADGLAGNYATAEQGALADTAVQPGVLTTTLAGYYTKSEADAAFMDSTETGNAIDAKITALNLATTYEPIGAETRAKAYADGLASNYATAAQGAKADTAIQNVTTTANEGLKVSVANNVATVDIDENVVFVLNCGSSSVLVD